MRNIRNLMLTKNTIKLVINNTEFEIPPNTNLEKTGLLNNKIIGKEKHKIPLIDELDKAINLERWKHVIGTCENSEDEILKIMTKNIDLRLKQIYKDF